MTGDADGGPIGRRPFLKLGAAASTGLAGCSRTGTPPPRTTTGPVTTGQRGTDVPAIASRFDRVVDLAATGADDTGTEPINWVLDDHLADDTLVYLPDGTYAVEAQTVRDLDNAGLVSAAGATPTIVPIAPQRELGSYLLTFTEVRDFFLEGLRFDFREDGYGGRVQVISNGDFTVRDIETVGRYPDDTTAFRFDVRSSEGTGLVDRLVAERTRQTNRSVTGLYVGHQHSGELTFRDCRVAWFPDNGLYASAPGGAGGEIDGAGDGPVHVEGGVYRNNNVANVRLGSTGSTARGVTIEVDEVPPHRDDVVNARGLRLRGQRDQIIENCDIRIGPEAGGGFGAVVLHYDNGRAFFRNTRIHIDRDGVPAIYAIRPDTMDPTGPVFEDVVITGSASGGDTALITGRDETTFRGCCIEQTGEDRNGIRFDDCQDCVVDDSVIDVTGSATLRIDSSVERTGVRYDGGCPR